MSDTKAKSSKEYFKAITTFLEAQAHGYTTGCPFGSNYE